MFRTPLILLSIFIVAVSGHGPAFGAEIHTAARDGETDTVKKLVAEGNVRRLIIRKPDGASLLVAADCVPVAYAGFHSELLRDRVVVVGCPKLDDVESYVEKLAEIIAASGIKSLTVVHMEVPCCYGHVHLAQKALAQSGRDIPFRRMELTLDGRVKPESKQSILG